MDFAWPLHLEYHNVTSHHNTRACHTNVNIAIDYAFLQKPIAFQQPHAILVKVERGCVSVDGACQTVHR